MIKNLNQYQQEIYDYYLDNGYNQTCEKFSLKPYQVIYIVKKKKRIDESDNKKLSDSTFIKLYEKPLSLLNDRQEVIFKLIDGNIKMAVEDFRKVFKL